MSVNVDGKNLFTKEMANVFETEVIECPDCGFEFASKHEQDNAKGCYECPCCNEANLLIEAERYKKALERISVTTMSMGYTSVGDLASGLRKIAKKALES